MFELLDEIYRNRVEVISNQIKTHSTQSGTSRQLMIKGTIISSF